MSYTVKLAIFQPWKAPVPYETIEAAFPTMSAASKAAEDALAPITERELRELAAYFQPTSNHVGEREITAIRVPDVEVHGFLIYDNEGLEVSNWTTLDVAVSRAANRRSEPQAVADSIKLTV